MAHFGPVARNKKFIFPICLVEAVSLIKASVLQDFAIRRALGLREFGRMLTVLQGQLVWRDPG